MSTKTIKLTSINFEFWTDKFEVDGENQMTVDNAKYDLEKLGEGWRLPTIFELRLINHLRSFDPNYYADAEEDYWTSEEDPEIEGCHKTFSFSDEDNYSRFDTERLHVIPVRTTRK